MAISEADIIDKLAGYAESISGVKSAFKFAQNPDRLQLSQLPAILFYPPKFSSVPKGHYNLWKTDITVRGILFVATRQSRAGHLKFLENEALPYGQKFRDTFQTDTVIKDLLTLGAGTTTAWLESGQYGAGGPLLTLNSVEYIGWIFEWHFTEVS